MKLARLTPVIEFEIWNPRWHDRVALIANFRIGTHNKITFPKAPTLAGEWYISGEKARTYPLENMPTKNGSTLAVRAVPLADLEPLERTA